MVEKHKARLQEIQNQRLAGLRQVAEQLGKQTSPSKPTPTTKATCTARSARRKSSRRSSSTFTITADQVRLKGPLKELGLYTVKIHLGQEIEGELKVWVVPTVTEEPAADKKKAGKGQGREAGEVEWSARPNGRHQSASSCHGVHDLRHLDQATGFSMARSRTAG